MNRNAQVCKCSHGYYILMQVHSYLPFNIIVCKSLCISNNIPLYYTADGFLYNNYLQIARFLWLMLFYAPLYTADGGWSDWKNTGECSSTCRGGYWLQQRECNNPPPSSDGAKCVGSPQKYASCNSHILCPGGKLVMLYFSPCKWSKLLYVMLREKPLFV